MERQKKSVVKSLVAKTSNEVKFRDYLVIILKALTITRADYSRDYRHDQVFLSSFRVNHVTCLDNLSTFALDDIIE